MKIVIKKGGTSWFKKFHFTAIAANGEPVGRSRKCGTVDDCQVLINRIKKFCQTGIGLKFDIDKNYNGKQKYHFRIVSDNSEDIEILFWSENYYNRQDCEDTKELVRTEFSNAEVVIET